MSHTSVGPEKFCSAATPSGTSKVLIPFADNRGAIELQLQDGQQHDHRSGQGVHNNLMAA